MKSFFSSVGWILFLAGLTVLAIFSRQKREMIRDMFKGILAVADWEN
jgi:hypothetical protein